MVGILSDIKKPSENDKDSNANALVDYALLIVKQEPARALQMGELAINVGVPRELYRLVWELNRNNPKLAIRLFNAALVKARNDPSYNRLQAVQVSAFPEILISDFPATMMLGQSERIAALSFLAEFIIQAQSGFERQNAKCSNEASIVGALKNQFSAMLPAQAVVVQHAVNTCLGGQSPQWQSLQDTIKASTVEDLLKMADEQKDNPLLRIAYLYRAALLSYNEKRYELAIKILDGMNEKERLDDLEFWEDIRSSSAGFLAFVRYTEGDHQGWRKVLQDTPSPIRAFAQFGFIKQFPFDDSLSYSIRVEVLKEMQRNLIRSDLPIRRKVSYWFQSIRILANHKFGDDASDVFKDIVNAFNDAVYDKKDGKLEISRTHVNTAFTPEFLETQDSRIYEIVTFIRDPHSRINVKFALLKVALDTYENLRLDASKPKFQSFEIDNRR